MWTKDLYDTIDNDVLHLIPPTTKTALVVGSGWGAAEAAMASSGIDVTALPVDPVFGDALRRRGIRTIEANFDEAIDELPIGHFDAILALDVLHMIQEPTRWVERLRGLLRKDGGVLIVSIPQMRDVADPKQIVRHIASARTGPRLQAVGVRHVKKWLTGAGLNVYRLVPLTAPRRELVARASLGALRRALAYRFLVAARVTSS
jgi:cyclopropane fatty-acyl-phospholipid synthase-like methyltransferase